MLSIFKNIGYVILIFLLTNSAYPQYTRKISALLKSYDHFSNYRYFEPISLKTSEKTNNKKNYYRICYDKHFRIKVAIEFIESRLKRFWYYEYNSDSNVESCTEYKSNIRRISWIYNELGMVKRKNYYSGYLKPFKYVLYIYDKNNRLLTEKVIMNGNKLLKFTSYDYHPTGSVMLKTVFTGGGAVSGRSFYKTDENGNIIEESEYSWGRLINIFIYKYSDRGFFISKKNRKINKNDRLIDPYHVKNKK